MRVKQYPLGALDYFALFSIRSQKKEAVRAFACAHALGDHLHLDYDRAGLPRHSVPPTVDQRIVSPLLAAGSLRQKLAAAGGTRKTLKILLPIPSIPPHTTYLSTFKQQTETMEYSISHSAHPSTHYLSTLKQQTEAIANVCRDRKVPSLEQDDRTIEMGKCPGKVPSPQVRGRNAPVST